MNKLKKVWVLAEQEDILGQLCSGGRLLGEEVAAIALGDTKEAEKAIELGVDKVYLLGKSAETAMMEDYVDTILNLLNQEAPDLLMIQASRRGKLVAGRLAAALNTSVIVDASELLVSSKGVEGIHMVYGGVAYRKEKPVGDLAIATIGSGAFSASMETGAGQGQIIEVDYLEPKTKVKLLERKKREAAQIDLHGAKNVLGVGRGIAAQEDLQMVEELASLLGAEIGCTRPLAEGVNWLPRERYIGVSGAMLKPELYFALGLSGQIQHMVGANQARVIVAINKDKSAPIFDQCDFGIVGDLYKILPPLMEKLKGKD